MTWYEHKHWNESKHREFYNAYRLAEPALQSKALIAQAVLLCKHLDETTLKAAESLLILWMRDHFNKKKAKKVYELLADICHRIGDHKRAQDFESKSRNL